MNLTTREKESIIKFRDGSVYNLSDFTITTKKGETIILGYNESTALTLLIMSKDPHITRGDLVNEIWGKRGLIVDDSSLTQCISRLRKQLNNTSLKEVIAIKTIPKIGYKASTLKDEEIKIIRVNRKRFPVRNKKILSTALGALSIMTIITVMYMKN